MHAATNVSGYITSDTTWSLANSPYKLTGTVFVNPGATLTIEPGVSIDFYTSTLQVSGTLVAKGTSDSNIVLYTSYPIYSTTIFFAQSSASWDESTGTGSIIDNVVLNCASISISGCSPKISNNYFANSRSTAISISNGSSLILNNAFNGQANAISVSNMYVCSPIISGNFVRCGVNNYGITANTNSYVSGNNVTGCFFGIYATGNTTVSGNFVRNCTYGIYTSGNATASGNTVANASIGINAAGGTVRYDTIGNNQVGIAVSSASANISQNNIFANTQYNLGMSTTNAADVSNNWWGTTDPAAINQTIYDNKNSTSIGKANFTPFLSDPITTAPALESVNYLPNPTPTPIPTPVPAPTPTYIPIPTNTWAPTPTATQPPTQPTSSPTPIPTPTPVPTPTPTPKVMPGSPLSLGGQSFAEAISQFDITQLAKIVLVVLGIMWVIVISVYVGRHFGHQGKTKKQ